MSKRSSQLTAKKSFLVGRVQRLLAFFNLLDRSDRFSITNLAVYVALVKLALSTGSNPVEIGALFLTLLNYAHKRHVSKDVITNEQ